MVKMQWSLLVLIVMGQCSSIGGQLCDYHFIGENMTWKEAKDYCRKNHTDLATVSNQTDMQRLLDSTTEQYQGGAWIGLQDNTTNTAWRWSQSGVEFNESKWFAGQPNNFNNQENCVWMKDDTWDDASCNGRHTFICYDEHQKSGKPFYISDKKNKKTWLEAQSYCREKYTDLMSGVKQLEDFKSQRRKDAEPFWIGLFRDCWSWSDGSSFRSWDEHEPEKKCAMAASDGKWSSDDCDEKKPFFCYKGQCSSIGCQLCDYHFIGDKKTWKEAQEYCRKNHTDLARVSNEADMQRLRGSTTEQYQDGVWIGLQRDWCWSLPGVEFNESKWHQGQPNNEGNHEICVMMKDDTWDDDSCTKKYKFICYDGHGPRSPGWKSCVCLTPPPNLPPYQDIWRSSTSSPYFLLCSRQNYYGH